MLPTTLVTIISVLLKLSCSSPVYNMQPAYITATIGSTGRNIRNLPCISRKSSESGVCMFAIDCLKANGTHLGTCIDRFYFGSCCHIEPVHDITENTIDTALIPSRQPPNRVTSTTEKNTTVFSTVTTESAPTTIVTTKITTTTEKAVTTDKTTSSIQEMLTKLTTLAKVTATTPASAVITKRPSVITTTTTKVPFEDDEVPYKISTFQSVDGSEVTTTLKPFPTTTLRPVSSTTLRPFPTTTSKTITASSSKPITTSSSKPVKPVTVAKPSKPISTHKPKPVSKPTHNVTTIYRPTHKPVTKVTTKPKPRPTQAKPVKVTKPATNTTRVTVKPTKAPTTPASKIPSTEFVVNSKKPPQTTTPPKTTTMTKITSFIVTKPDKPTTPVFTQTETTTHKPPKPTISDEEPTTVKNVAAMTESNELPINLNNSGVSESVNGNPATNEIESEKPIRPAPAVDVTTLPTLVTWSQVHDNATTEAGSSSSSSEEPEEWVPITTPDGWVLLPSLSTVTEPTSSESTSSSSQPASSSVSSEASSASSSQSTSTESADSTSIETIVSLSTTSSEETSSQMALGSSPDDANTTASVGITTETTFTSSKPVVNMTDYTDVCGRRMFPEARIVGGEKSSFGKWPWQISLRQWRTSTYLHKCGAALLNENWAITAAHCVDNVPPSDLLLRLGEHDLSTESEPYLHQERRVQIVASHPQFDPRTFEYDLALLRFYEPVSFQPNIIPVCVPQNDENFVGRTAYVTGWGRLYEDGPLPSILQEVSVPVINNTVCESMYRSAGYIEHIPNIFICAGWRRGGFDSCEGDSGGPMVIQRPDKRFLLAGVISWGIGCAEPNQPGVYTRISEFRDWINQILQF